jgi:hypothetical protein
MHRGHHIIIIIYYHLYMILSTRNVQNLAIHHEEFVYIVCAGYKIDVIEAWNSVACLYLSIVMLWDFNYLSWEL